MLKPGAFRDRLTTGAYVTNDPDDVKTLIADIDNTLALFVANAMFSNTRVVNADDHAKAKSDLEHIVALSSKLQTVSAAQVDN